jgi:hypothetical protein
MIRTSDDLQRKYASRPSILPILKMSLQSRHVPEGASTITLTFSRMGLYVVDR